MLSATTACEGEVASDTPSVLDGGPFVGMSNAGASADGALPRSVDAGATPDGSATGPEPEPMAGTPRGTCGSGGPETDGFERVDLTLSHYLIAAPGSPGPHPLVISLHGDGSGARSGAMTTWMPVWRAREDFVLVAPEAPTGGPSWRLGDQEASIDHLIDVLNDVSRRYDIDVNRIYVQGFSGGSTFLGWFGFLFQNVFAGMALHCGGWSLERANYRLTNEACRTPARFVIGDGDFLRPTARGVYDDLDELGHEVAWVEAGCTGHCCGDQTRLVADTLAWFDDFTKCGADDTGGCGRIDDTP